MTATFFLYDFIPYWLSFNPLCLLLELLLLLLSNFQFFFKEIKVTSMYFRAFKDLYSSDALHHIYTTLWRWCVCVCVCVCGQLSLTLCKPMGCSPPDSSVYGIFQARMLEQVAISCSRGSCRLRDWAYASAGEFFTTVPPGKPRWRWTKRLLRQLKDLGCEVLLLLFSHSVVSDSLRPHGLQHTRLPCPFTISQSLLTLMSVELVMPSNHLILCHPLLFLPSIFPSIRVFSNESALPIRWPNNWSFSFSISAPNEYSGLISFRIGWFDLLGILKSLLQHHSSKASILQLSAFFRIKLSHSWKNHSFD